VLVPRLLKRLFSAAPHMQANVVSWIRQAHNMSSLDAFDLALIGEHDCLSWRGIVV
jgi:hypothetical protein